MVLAVLAFFFAPLTLAGGQLVHLEADSQGWTNRDSYGRTMRFSLNSEYPCKDTEVTFKFKEPKDGDLITTEGIGATYIGKENGSLGDHCQTYAKFASKVNAERYVTVEVKNNGSVWHSPPIIKVHFDGQYHPDNHYGEYAYTSYFSNTYSTPNSGSESKPTGTITLKKISEKHIMGVKRLLELGWNSVPGAVKYNLYARTADTRNYGAALDGTGSLSTQIGLNAYLDFYAKVDACNSYGCISSPEIFIPAIKKEDVLPSSKPAETTTSHPDSAGDSKEVEELNKKVENLQNQLDQSKKTQNALEQRINELVSFIKRLFTFFK